jgi:PKD domain-containing protein
MAAHLLRAAAAAALLALGVPATASAASPPQFVTTQWLLRVPAGIPVGFVATAIDPDGDTVELTWAFDDGTVATGERVTKAWTAPGAHTVTVTATDATGLSAAKTFAVEVTAAGPAAPVPAPAGVLLRRPGPAPALAARLTIAGGALRLGPGGSIAVPVACGPAADCTGRISVAHGGRRLATTPYAVRAGRTATVRLRLPSAVAARLRRRAAATVVVTVAPRGQAPVRSPRALNCT